VRYAGARPGTLLVYNMNFDPSWQADARPALQHEDAVAALLLGPEGTLEFRYVPRTLRWSIALPVLTLAGCAVGGYVLARRRRA
jgi:hypothetical protein